MTELIIVGAGGSSREIASAVVEINRVEKRWDLRGFLDDDPAKRDQLVDGLPVLGPLEAARAFPIAQFVLGVASYRQPGIRRRIVASLGLARDRFARLVHPTASISELAEIGPGTVVLQNAVVTCGARLGQHVLISAGVLIAHDVVLKDYVTLAPGAIVSGGVQIDESSYVGTGAILAPGCRVGGQALVGLGAVVTGDVGEGATVFGNPARAINAGGERMRRWTP